MTAAPTTAAPAPTAANPVADWSRERALVEGAAAAVTSADYASARAKAAEAVSALLARPEPEQDSAWLELLNRAGSAAWKAQDWRIANEAWQRVLETRSRSLPDEHADVLAAQGNVAMTMALLGDLEGARVLQEQVLATRSRTMPADHPDVQKARGNLAATMSSLGDLAGARALEEQVLAARLRTMPSDHNDVQVARLNLAGTISALGDLTGARALYEQVFEVYSRTLPDDHPSLQAAREGLATTLKELGDLAGARALEEQVLAIRLRTLPDDHPDLQAAQMNLAGTLYLLGDVAGARPIFERLLEVRSRTLPDDHPDVQVARANLAAAMMTQGDLADARVLFERVLDVRSRTLPADHPDLQSLRQNLAGTLYGLGDLVGARALEEQVLDVYLRTLPADHPDIQSARQGLAITMSSLGELEGARVLFEQVLEVRSRVLPDDHPDLQIARAHLATAMKAQDDLAEACALEEQALEVYSRTLPQDQSYLQALRLNHAGTIRSLGDLAGARALQEQVIEVYSRTGSDGPALQAARQNLVGTIVLQAANAMRSAEGNARSQDLARDQELCAELVRALCQDQTKAARAALVSSSSREAEERCAGLAGCLDLALSLAGGCGVFDPLPELDRAAFVLSETTRGAAPASARLRRMSALSPRQSELRASTRTASNELARLAQAGASSAEFQRALAQRDAAERELLMLAREVAPGAADWLELDLDRLAERLGDREAAIGFRRYDRGTFEVRAAGDAGDSSPLEEQAVTSLCALVLRPGGERAGAQPTAPTLVRVELGPVEPIEAAVRAWRDSLGVASQARGVSVSRAPQRAGDAQALGRELRRLVFDPLVPALADVDRIVVAMDDVLHLIPLDALPAETTSSGEALLGDRWRIETRAGLWELLIDDEPSPARGALVALGGADYGSAPRAEERDDLLRDDAWSGGFAVLPETALEVEALAREASGALGSDQEIVLLTGVAATRERLTDAAAGACWLHVATHGWFAPESIASRLDAGPLDALSGSALRMSGEEQVEGLSPMLLAGLALAGANLPADALGRAPGLLTAEELAALDLSSCDLAVLSACDTNVGLRRAGQGVASLQKALQMAGARSVITSLWKVPDEATKMLMLDFYRRLWVEQKPKGQALWEAKMALRLTKDESGAPRYTTRDWAGWVLTGDPD